MSNVSKVDKDVKSENRRQINRQHVVLKAMLVTGDYEFECVAYDLSLAGIKIKLDLPLKTACEVWLMIKDAPHIPATVAWSEDGYIGIKFSAPQVQIAEMLGNLGTQLSKS